MEEKWVSNSNINYISALILMLITGLLMVSIVLPRILSNLLLLALFLSTSVLYLQWRTPDASRVETISIILVDILYFTYSIVTTANTIILGLLFLLAIVASISLVRKDPIALVPIFSLIIESMFHPLQKFHYLTIVLLLSIMPLVSSKKIHSLLPLIVAFLVLMVTPNSFVSTLTMLTYILFISSSIETINKCPFRREISLVIGGFLIQAIIILIMFSYEPFYMFSYWILGYMISAIGLTSPPFYKPSLDNKVVYRTDA
ncbi:MAG: hypothetical protein GSR79_06975 [Desulfurococcales archaeon]|nr:hypothetical protein [Desulfurococcales archaeon]